MRILPYLIPQCNKICDFTGLFPQLGLSAGDPGSAGGGQGPNPLTGRYSYNPPFLPRSLLYKIGLPVVAFGGPVSSFGGR
jgi:hypothetical protein